MQFFSKIKGLYLLSAMIFMAFSAQAAEIPDQAKKAGFAPHKALYEIKLAGTKSGSQVVNITGQMLYEWEPACEAWNSNHRFNLFYEYADTPATQITSDFSTYETFDGKTMNFTSQRKRDGELFEEMRGQATIGADGTGEAIYTMPKDLEFDLPKGSVFPMFHSLNVIDALKQGKKFYKATVFDGSDEKGPVEINAFIGKPVDALTTLEFPPEVNKTLLASAGHKIRLAFFPLSDDSATSDYEMDIVFHENGVISDMFIEYSDFSVSQKLIALEPLEGSCKSTVSRD